MTAAVFAAVMLGGILWNRSSYFLLFFLIGALTLWEYTRLARKLDGRHAETTLFHRIFLVAAGSGIVIFFAGDNFNIAGLAYGLLGPWIFGISLCIVLMSEAFSRQTGKLRRIAISLFGLTYISISAGLLVDLGLEKAYFGFPLIPLAIILLIWINDTMAYMVGSLIGRRPFYPVISPKKTWEGTVGGALLTMAGAALFAWIGKYYTVKDWIVLGGIVAVLGTFGDLFESGLKRMALVKDSGSIMPGHGGFLDRFDSLWFVIPFAWIYAIYFM